MRIFTDENVIELRVLETGREDFHVGIHIKANGFTAHKDSIGISRAGFALFLEQLRTFKDLPEGEITLESMSTGEFRLQFRAAGKRYHVVVQGHLNRTIYQAESALLNTLYFAFRLDSSYLRTVVSEFEGLLGTDHS